MRSNTEYPSARTWLDQLASNGRYTFTSEEARTALGVSPAASKQALNRLGRQGLLASPARGFYVIVPPQYRSLGCLPAEQFIPQLMSLKGLAYYVGLASAAQYYGAAHQRPQEFQVLVANNRRPIRCGKVRVKFIARRNVESVPIRKFNTPRGELSVSTPEATAIDLVGYSEHVGGLDGATTVLAELAESIEPRALAQAASTAPITWIQRLGYLLEFLEEMQAASGLRDYVRRHAREYTLLVPGHGRDAGPRATEWKLVVNAELEPDI